MDEFPILKLPEDLIRYTLRFVDPDQFHRLYRVSVKINNIVSDKKFLLDKLEWDLGVPKFELEPLFDRKSRLHLLTPYLRYVRTLTFYNKIIRSSTAWLEQKLCLRRAREMKDVKLIKYFAGENAKYILGEEFNGDNYLACIRTHIKGEKVKCDTIKYDIKDLKKILTAAENILKGKLSKIPSHHDAECELLEFMVENGQFELAKEFATREKLQHDLQYLLQGNLIKRCNLNGCREDNHIHCELYKSRDYEFIKQYLEKFPNPKISEYYFWTPEFAKALLESGNLRGAKSIPALYIVKYLNKIPDIGKLKAYTLLCADVMAIEFSHLFSDDALQSKFFCSCGKTPYKYKRCECDKIIYCNFCVSDKIHCQCEICKHELCKKCLKNSKCDCDKIFCENCVKFSCSVCSKALCKSCKIYIKVYKDIVCKECFQDVED